MKGLGEGIAFTGLVAATAYLEVHGRPVEWLWVLVVVWAVFSTWGKRNDQGEYS